MTLEDLVADELLLAQRQQDAGDDGPSTFNLLKRFRGICNLENAHITPEDLER